MPQAKLFEEGMSWSWSNPTPEEATDAYNYYKSKYNSAASQKKASEQQESNYRAQKDAAKNALSNAKSDKVNFEKRLRGIEDIIKMLEGTGGWFSTDVPGEISTATKRLSKTEESFRKSIVREGSTPPKSLEQALEIKTVEGNNKSAAALQDFKNEKSRLETEIANLNAQIANLSNTISSLTSKINSCNATQFSLQVSMNSYAYDMNHYKKYTY